MDRKNQIILNIKGLHCANCAAKIERKINEINYVKEAHIDFMGEKILLETEETNKNVLVGAIQKIANSIEEGVRIFSTENLILIILIIIVILIIIITRIAIIALMNIAIPMIRKNY